MLNKIIITFFIIWIGAVVFFISNQVQVESTNYALLSKTRSETALASDSTMPIKVGVSFTNDENSEVKNIDFKNGIELAVNIINQDGLLNGRKIELIYDEYPNDIESAKEVSRDFSKNLDIVATISNSETNIAIPMSIDYEFSGLTFISTAATDPLFTRDSFNYIFRNVTDDIFMAKSLAKLADNLQYENMVVLHSKSKYGNTLSNVFIQKGTELGINMIYRTSFSDGDRIFKKVISKISPSKNKDIDYDAIFIAGDLSSVSNLIIQLRESGIYAPIITGHNLDNNKLLEIGDAANGVIVPTYFNLDILNFKTQEFIKIYKDKYNLLPSSHSVEGFDSISLLSEAIKKAKTTEPSDVSESLKYIGNFESISGDYSLNTKGDVVNKNIFFKKVINNRFKFLNIK